jgi:hypothetical protein
LRARILSNVESFRYVSLLVGRRTDNTDNLKNHQHAADMLVHFVWEERLQKEFL